MESLSEASSISCHVLWCCSLKTIIRFEDYSVDSELSEIL